MTSVEWVNGNVRFIDQTKLPAREVYVDTSDYRRVGEAIKRLEIRGAPAIGVAAAFGVALAMQEAPHNDDLPVAERIDAAIAFLSETRPTAVNLFQALERMRLAYLRFKSSNLDLLCKGLLEEALAIQREDADACRRIGEYGAALISIGSSLLTHCNTGALATSGEGTAQSIITTAAREGKVVRVYVDETRPLFQGARLTAWELAKHGVESVVITDSTAGFLMQQKKIQAVLVGADRIAANGDVANKIGTYSLAVLARYHGIPFYVAAPCSTIDRNAPSGHEIPVEERDPREITHVAGMAIAAPGVAAYAPAFDITPHKLVTAIVTDVGVLRAPYSSAVARLKRGGEDRGGAPS